MGTGQRTKMLLLYVGSGVVALNALRRISLAYFIHPILAIHLVMVMNPSRQITSA